jgi:hypothetical protein
MSLKFNVHSETTLNVKPETLNVYDFYRRTNSPTY